jgi:hypothetical protein
MLTAISPSGARMKQVAAVGAPGQAAELLALTSDRRRHQRVKVTLLGRYMLEDRREFPCQTIDMSPGGVALFAPVKAPVGARIVAYIDEIGRIEGTAARHLESGFAMALNVSPVKREKFADQLTWLANRHTLGLPEDRRHERILPRSPRATLILPDGREHLIKIIDVSLSGAALTADIRPPLGTIITIGRTKGRIVRHLDGGIAVEFLRLMPIETFDENLRL